jgi:uncharacterized protein YgiM (DUF1202 family)
MRPTPFRTVHPSRLAASLALFAFSIAAAAGAAEVEPYEARIVTPGAPVHSGPGENYYRTDTLAQGETVEVYRQQPGGWLGIRPPADSFSWIFGRHVTLLDDGLAEINKDDVPSRIGSRLGEQRNAVQVRLKKGEVVEILSEERVGGQTWYKIAPPSGEFRWIDAQNVARLNTSTAVAPAIADPPAEPAEFTPAAGPIEPTLPPIVTVPIGGEVGQRPMGDVALAAGARTTDTDGAEQNWRPAPLSPPTSLPTSTSAAAASDESATPGAAAASVETATTKTSTQPGNAPASESESTPPTATPPAATPSAATQPAATTRPSPGPIDDGIARRLTDVELRLSRIVAEPPTTWQIAPLRQEADQLLAAETTDIERAAVNTTIAKLDRFAAISARYLQVAAGAGSGEPPTIGSGDPRAMASVADAQRAAPDTARYDAVGILRPVVSKRPGAPQFALVDERGQVAAFVTPTPDLNLQPYLGHRIGITGSRGFIPEFQRAHVTAGRVSPLSERMIR